MRCAGDLAYVCSCPITTDRLRLWAHERTNGVPRDVDDLQSVELADIIGAIDEDRHLTLCAPQCFVGAEGEESEPHDQGTIDDILGELLARKLSFLEQMPLPGILRLKVNV